MARRTPRRPGEPRGWPGTAALLSAVLPGAGHWWLGLRIAGLVVALPSILALGAIAILARGGAVGLAEILVQTRWLWALIVFNILIAILRVAAVADAWHLERPRVSGWRRSALHLAPAVVATLALLVPQVVVHRYTVEAIDLLNTIFAREPAPTAERIAELLEQGVTEEELGPTISPTTLPGSTTSSSTTTPAQSVAAALGDDLVTVLLAGGDLGPGRSDLRTDVMIVAALDLEKETAVLVGLSRDLVQAPLPEAWSQATTMIQVQQWHEDQAYQKAVEEAAADGQPAPARPPFVPCDCYADRLNYLHVHTANWVRTFPDAPDPGMEALRQVLEVTLGLPIDYYVLVDFGGFVDLVDALGGIDVHANETFHISASPAKEGEERIELDIAPGTYHLDGREALAYVRSREGANDGARMLRQRCLLRDLAAELDAGTLLTRFLTIAEVVERSTTSTIPLDLLPDLLAVVGGLDVTEIETAAIGHPAHTSGLNYLELPIIDAAKAQAQVADLLAGRTVSTAGECG